MFIKVTKYITFPLKFCSIRWLENSAFAKKAPDILDNLKKYEEHVEKTKKLLNPPRASKLRRDIKLLNTKITFPSLAEDIQSFKT